MYFPISQFLKRLDSSFILLIVLLFGFTVPPPVAATPTAPPVASEEQSGANSDAEETAVTSVIQEVFAEVPILIALPRPVAAVVPIVGNEHVRPRLKIVRIDVDASIQDVGVTPEGAMSVPDSSVDVGWFSLGTGFGEIGSAVVGGHNRWDGVAGAFYRLEELDIGDFIFVVDAQGASTTFVVRETRMYDPTDDATDIFTSDEGIHLNLITCSGEWDPSTRSYTKRFVVFSDLLSSVLSRETNL